MRNSLLYEQDFCAWANAQVGLPALFIRPDFQPRPTPLC